MRALGWVLLLIGVVVVLAALAMDTTVPTGTVFGRVHNVGLVSDRNTALGVGGLAVIAGLLVVLLRKPLRAAEPLAESAAGTRSCPHCAERILLAAKVCRYCGRDVPGAEVDLNGPQQQVMEQLGISYEDGMYVVAGRRHFKYSEAVRDAAAGSAGTEV